MPTVTLTHVEFAAVVAASIALALLPGADLAKLALAVLYRKFGVSPAYADAVQEGEDVSPDEADGEDDSEN